MSDTRVPRVLVATADLGGNGPPALGIAARLAADGADVHVIGHDRQRSAVAASGLGFTAYTRDRSYDALTPRSVPSAILGLAGLCCDAGIAADLRETAATHRSDVLLVDCMLLTALRAGARSGVPTVALVHTFPDFFTGRWAHGPIGTLATLRGLRPGKVWAGLAGAVTVCLPELVGASTALGGPVVGPVWQGTPRPAVPSPGRPRVLISLSTVWWPGQDGVAQRVLDAVGGLDVDAVFTTGPALDPAAMTAPPTSRCTAGPTTPTCCPGWTRSLATAGTPPRCKRWHTTCHCWCCRCTQWSTSPPWPGSSPSTAPAWRCPAPPPPRRSGKPSTDSSPTPATGPPPPPSAHESVTTTGPRPPATTCATSPTTTSTPSHTAGNTAQRAQPSSTELHPAGATEPSRYQPAADGIDKLGVSAGDAASSNPSRAAGYITDRY